MEKTIEKLKQVSKDIEEAEKKMFDLAVKSFDIKQEIDNIEAENMLIVSMEEDEKGKKIYSNEMMRKTALKKVLNENKTFQEKIILFRNNDAEMRHTQIVRDSLLREFSIYKLLAKRLANS